MSMLVLLVALAAVFGSQTTFTSADDAAVPMVTDEIYFDITIAGQPAGRIVIGLFGDVVPKTVKNFKTIAEGNTTSQDGKLRFSYDGAPFHRVIKGFMIQGGDFSERNGAGSMSIYGRYFPDENFDLKHYGPFWVSSANAGKDTNGAQFFITTVKTPWLDGKHTVFGKVVQGKEVVTKIENLPVDNTQKPLSEVLIAKSGSLPVAERYTVSLDDTPPPKVTDEAFFDIEIGGRPAGTIVLGLFGEVVPKTVKNIKDIANGNATDPDGIALTYIGAPFHRVIKGFMIQTGDTEQKNGRGGRRSIYGEWFEDENFDLNHYGRYWVSMVNWGKANTNGQQFAIQVAKNDWLDGKHVVFAKVVKGTELVDTIENMQTDEHDRPLTDAVIVRSGSNQVEVPYTVALN